MKKSSKSRIAFTLFLLVVFTFLGLGYVSIKLKCEAMIKEKFLLGEQIKGIGNQHTALLGSRQDLTSEERITDIAKNELGMIPDSQPKMILKVSKDKIDEIDKKLKEKYE
jgi:cell division protein FtsL